MLRIFVISSKLDFNTNLFSDNKLLDIEDVTEGSLNTKLGDTVVKVTLHDPLNSVASDAYKENTEVNLTESFAENDNRIEKIVGIS